MSGGQRLKEHPAKGAGHGSELPAGVGPASFAGTRSHFAQHRHGDYWYLCDRAQVKGVRQHIIRESYGRSPPTLYRPEIRGGLADQVLPSLPPGSFDLVYLDPPYGVTGSDWDRVPDWEWLGRAVDRVLKPAGQVILHGQGSMAAHALVGLEKALTWRFEFAWIKAEGPESALHTGMPPDYAPSHAHELVHVFRRQEAPVSSLTYNPGAMHGRGKAKGTYVRRRYVSLWEYTPRSSYIFRDTGWRHPADVVFSPPSRAGQMVVQKPLDLTRYLILLLTKPGDRVLDPYAGTGTTLLAAYQTGRRSLGIEASPRSWKLLLGNLGVENPRARFGAPPAGVGGHAK